VITLSGASKGGMRHGVQALEAHQHTLFKHLKNEFFNRNADQNMPKNAYFLEKGCKISAAPGGETRWLPAAGDSVPRPLHCYSHLLI